jgi:hypothetical protein
MEKVKINLNDKVIYHSELIVNWIKPVTEIDGNGETVLTNQLMINVENINDISFVDNKLYFKRNVLQEDYSVIEASCEITVISIDYNTKTIITSTPDYGDYFIEDTSYLYTNENELTHIVIKLNKPHYRLQQHLEGYRDEIIYFYGVNNKLLYSASTEDFGVPITVKTIGESVEKSRRIIEREDCIVGTKKIKTCNNYDENIINEYEYVPLPYETDTYSIHLRDISVKDILPLVSYVTFKETPFYYKDGEHYKFRNNDIWWDDFNELNKIPIKSGCENARYITKTTPIRNFLVAKNFHYTIPLKLEQDSFSVSLTSEDSLFSLQINDLKETIVPDVIDMERLKYCPVIKGEDDNFHIATGMTFNLHFRCREEIPDDSRHLNSSFTSGNVYFDSWHINSEASDYTWWNHYQSKYSGATFDNKSFTEFFNASGETSDLLRFLNFNDNDVRFNKKKVKESFIRLYYYDNNDPLSQKLLAYSTIFLDGVNLSGKFIKQMAWVNDYVNNSISDIKNNSNSSNNEILANNVKTLLEKMNSNQSVAYVSIDEGVRLDSKITITNEYDRTKSSEGFNIYLFASDHNYNLENNEKTIYMKVEFNHAGNGQTIPMIMWPKDENGEFCGLTVDNFFNALYIPIKICYILDRYVYYIPSALNKNGNISLILFEPKLDEVIDENTEDIDG